MLGLYPKVVVHQLMVKHYVQLIKQADKWFWPKLISQIETKIDNLIEIGFIKEVKYPTWILNIISIKKKNGQIHVCVDSDCSKYDFPLPIIELMIDTTTSHEALSFMNGSLVYSQTQMAPRDEEIIAFRTLKGIYYYKAMFFGLKNVGATYQCVMQRIFDEILHKNVELYVDDLVLKSRKRRDHL